MILSLLGNLFSRLAQFLISYIASWWDWQLLCCSLRAERKTGYGTQSLWGPLVTHLLLCSPRVWASRVPKGSWRCVWFQNTCSLLLLHTIHIGASVLKLELFGYARLFNGMTLIDSFHKELKTRYFVFCIGSANYCQTDSDGSAGW